MSAIRAFLKKQRISTGVYWTPIEYPFSNHTYFLQVYPQKKVYDRSEDWKQEWKQKHKDVTFVEYEDKRALTPDKKKRSTIVMVEKEELM